MNDMKINIIINLHDNKQIKVVYDYEKDCIHIIKPNTIITVSDMRDSIFNTILHLSNNAYDMKNIEFVDDDILNDYYEEINRLWVDEYCDMDLLKDLFESYMNNINYWL